MAFLHFYLRDVKSSVKSRHAADVLGDFREQVLEHYECKHNDAIRFCIYFVVRILYKLLNFFRKIIFNFYLKKHGFKSAAAENTSTMK